MRRGTTPTIQFECDADLSAYQRVVLTFKAGCGCESVDVEKERITIVEFTNARGEGAAAVGQYSLVDASTLFAVGDGTSHVARSNAFEVVDGGIVLKSPGGTRYKIAVDDAGNLTATAL